MRAAEVDGSGCTPERRRRHQGRASHREEVANAVMAPIEGPRVAGEEAAHALGYGTPAGAHQEMGVVREEGPGVDGSGALLRQPGEAGDEGRAVRVIPDDDALLHPSHHGVVQGVGRVEATFAGHGERDGNTHCYTWQRSLIQRKPGLEGVHRIGHATL